MYNEKTIKIIQKKHKRMLKDLENVSAKIQRLLEFQKSITLDEKKLEEYPGPYLGDIINDLFLVEKASVAINTLIDLELELDGL